MDGYHSSIFELYFLYNMYVLWYKLCILFTLKFMNVIQYKDDFLLLY